MALGDHLRELRARLLRIVLVLVVATVVSLFFYKQLFELILGPYNEARSMLKKDVVSKPVINGVTDPLMIQLKICGLAAVIATCPYWLYQIWAFIVPGEPLRPGAAREGARRGEAALARREGARYYNVQLFAGKKRIRVSWPAGHRVELPKGKLMRGTNTLVRLARHRREVVGEYGKLIGKSPSPTQGEVAPPMTSPFRWS